MNSFMNKSIDYLKSVVNDGSYVQSIHGGNFPIRRFPNNIIMIKGCSISWIKFKHLLDTQQYTLHINEIEQELPLSSDLNWGGSRQGSGRPKKNDSDKKKIRSFSLSQAAIDVLDDYIKSAEGSDQKVSYSSIVELLILRRF